MCESKLNSSKLSSAIKVQGFQMPFRRDNHILKGINSASYGLYFITKIFQAVTKHVENYV